MERIVFGRENTLARLYGAAADRERGQGYTMRRGEHGKKCTVTVIPVHYFLFAAWLVSGFLGFADLPGDTLGPRVHRKTATSATRQYSMSSSCGTYILRT
ncbi:hypothetical protein NKJ28_20710 [Mesorhizobium sp. M0145]|uniref:hypothetical protein n=1 Tax=unclassified Mesorhizobium TaxID=325217 RepID=UPI003338F405